MVDKHRDVTDCSAVGEENGEDFFAMHSLCCIFTIRSGMYRLFSANAYDYLIPHTSGQRDSNGITRILPFDS